MVYNQLNSQLLAIERYNKFIEKQEKRENIKSIGNTAVDQKPEDEEAIDKETLIEIGADEFYKNRAEEEKKRLEEQGATVKVFDSDYPGWKIVMWVNSSEVENQEIE